MNTNDQSEADRLINCFFRTFAQYESSLKRKGFYLTDRFGNINVDWDRFANEVIQRSFINDLGNNSHAADFIFTNPPRKQFFDGEKISWTEPSIGDKSVQALIGYICRIRNNLFHGGKFNSSGDIRSQRDEDLIKNSLVILNHFFYRLNDYPDIEA